jgi:hypothetical protein
MNRAERRKQGKSIDKGLGKDINTIKNLTPAQARIMDMVSEEKAVNKFDEYVKNFSECTDRCLSALLLDLGFSLKEINALENKYGNLMKDDGEKFQKLKGSNVDMNKISMEVKLEIEKLIKDGVSKKKAAEELEFKFPKLSKSMLINAYAKVKESMEEDPDVYDAMEKVSDILDESDEMNNKEVKTVLAESDKVVENANEILEAAKKAQCEKQAELIKNPVLKKSTLKVLSLIVEGENGTYKVCDKGIELSNEGMLISFENAAQVDKWANEIKEVFAMRG